METILDNPHNTIYFDQENQLHYQVTKPATGNLYEEEFKEMLITWKESIFKLEPRLLLIDNRELQYPITPTVQEWIAQNITLPIAEHGAVKKCCFVMPQEFIAQLSQSQLNQEIETVNHTVSFSYFADLEEAKAWLLA